MPGRQEPPWAQGLRPPVPLAGGRVLCPVAFRADKPGVSPGNGRVREAGRQRAVALGTGIPQTRRSAASPLLDQEPAPRRARGVGPAQPAHLPPCSRCPRACWSSCGPWWTTRRTRRRGCSPCNPCTRLSPCPADWGRPGDKWGSLQEPPGASGGQRVGQTLSRGGSGTCGNGAPTCDGGTRSKFLPSILRMCFRACEVIWCLRRKENWQPSRMQWK